MASEFRPFTIAPLAYRLPAALELGPVVLQVANLARSVDYYERVLGLSVIASDSESARLGVNGATDFLVHLRENHRARPVPRRGRLGLYHFAILLPNRTTLGRLLAHLAALGEYAGMADHLVSEALYLTDPDGLGIEVYADRPRDSWRRNGDALAMATDPLNVSELLALARGLAWTGMPAGTRIGHVHLYVGNLRESEAFYHRGMGFDKVALDFPGALFMSAGGYHHHLGTNTWAAGAPAATDDDARLLQWTVRLPDVEDVANAAASIENAGYVVERNGDDVIATDSWGTRVRITESPKRDAQS